MAVCWGVQRLAGGEATPPAPAFAKRYLYFNSRGAADPVEGSKVFVGLAGYTNTQGDYQEYAYLLPKAGKLTSVEVAIGRPPTKEDIVFTVLLGPASPADPVGTGPAATSLTGTIDAGSGVTRVALTGAPVSFSSGQHLILKVVIHIDDATVVYGAVETDFS